MSHVCNLIVTLDCGKLIYLFTHLFIKHLTLYFVQVSGKAKIPEDQNSLFQERQEKLSVHYSYNLLGILRAKHFNSLAMISKYHWDLTLQLKNGFLQIARSHLLVKP